MKFVVLVSDVMCFGPFESEEEAKIWAEKRSKTRPAVEFRIMKLDRKEKLRIKTR